MTDVRIKFEIDNHPSVRKYRVWKEINPTVFNVFEKLCLGCIEKGRKFGISLITERVRWEYFYEYNADFKIRNEFRALIIRELMLVHPVIKSYCSVKALPWADCFFDEEGNIKLREIQKEFSYE